MGPVCSKDSEQGGDAAFADVLPDVDMEGWPTWQIGRDAGAIQASRVLSEAE